MSKLGPGSEEQEPIEARGEGSNARLPQGDGPGAFAQQASPQKGKVKADSASRQQAAGDCGRCGDYQKQLADAKTLLRQERERARIASSQDPQPTFTQAPAATQAATNAATTSPTHQAAHDDLVRQLKQQLQQELEQQSKQATMNEDYDRIVMLQEEVERLGKQFGELRKEHSELRSRQQIDHAALEARDKDVAAKDKEIAALRDSCTKLKEEKDHVEAMRVHDEGLADKAKSDLVKAAVAREKELRATRQERDELQGQFAQKKQKLEDTEEELNEAYHTIRDHEENADLVEHYEKRQEEMSTDMDKLRELMEDSNRLLLVKDERIAQLEKQLQRERERIHKAAEAAEAARASSPAYDDHYQQVDSMLEESYQPADSLQDELAEAQAAFSDYADSDFAPQPSELSRIESILNYAPRKPGRVPANLALAPVREAANTDPKQATVPEHTFQLVDAVDIAPKQATVPEHTLQLVEAIDIAPKQATVPEHTLQLVEAIDVAPKQATEPTFSGVEAPPASVFESWWMLFFLVLGFLWTFRQPDGPSSVTAGAFYNGAFGNDRSLAGFPILSGIGGNGVTEALGRLVSISVTSWEGWLGIVSASLY